MATTLYFLVITLFLIICMILCFVILIQESKSTGLGASFGGETTDSLFGTSTADVLKQFTSWMAVAFLASCVLLSVWTSAMGRGQQVPAESLMEQVQPD